MSLLLKIQSNMLILVLLLPLLFPLLSLASQVNHMTSVATLSASTVAKSALPESSPDADSTAPGLIEIHDELEGSHYEDDANWFNISDSNSLLPRQDIPCPDGAAVCADNWIIASRTAAATRATTLLSHTSKLYRTPSAVGMASKAPRSAIR